MAKRELGCESRRQRAARPVRRNRILHTRHREFPEVPSVIKDINRIWPFSVPALDQHRTAKPILQTLGEFKGGLVPVNSPCQLLQRLAADFDLLEEHLGGAHPKA